MISELIDATIDASDGAARPALRSPAPPDDRRLQALQTLLANVQASEPTPPWLATVRSRAVAVVQELGLPSTRDEDWRFCDLSPLLAHSFGVAEPLALEAPAIAQLCLEESQQTRLVFVNGRYRADLSDCSGLPAGATAVPLAEAIASGAPLEHYLAATPGSPEALSALNTAELADAAIVWIGQNVQVSAPIHVLFLSLAGSGDAIVQPRLLVVAEAGSQATVVEEYTTGDRSWCQNGGPTYLTNAVTELWLGENAQLQRSRVQWEAGDAYHVGRTIAVQARHSRLQHTEISVGAAISRHTLDIHQTGPATETQLYGLAVVNGTQVSDTHSSLLLNHPHGRAEQLHKCIADDAGRAVFNGRVFVGQAAQHTDASQLNRNLLLSSRARIDTKPQLEIIADDVKCAHGATVSQLEDNEIFYLRSRGLDRITARNLLLDGFAGEILDRLGIASLQTVLGRCIACQTEL